MSLVVFVWVLYWGPSQVSFYDTACQCEQAQQEKMKQGYVVQACHQTQKREAP